MAKIIIGVFAIMASIVLMFVTVGVQWLIPSFNEYFTSEVLTSAVFIVSGIVVIVVGVVSMHKARRIDKFYRRQNKQDEQRAEQETRAEQKAWTKQGGIWQESAQEGENSGQEV